MEFSKLQKICVNFLITKIDKLNDGYFDLLSPEVFGPNEKVKFFIKCVNEIAIGRNEPIEELEKTLSLISNENFESVFEITNGSIHPVQISFCSDLVNSLREIKNPSLRKLTKLESVLIPLLIHLASNNLNFLGEDLYSCLKRAAQGEEQDQKILLELPFENIDPESCDEKTFSYLKKVGEVIGEYNALYKGITACLESVQEEAKNKFDSVRIIQLYMVAHEVASTALEIGYPNGKLLDSVLESFYNITVYKIELAIQEKQFDKSTLLFKDAQKLVKQLALFKHEQADSLDNLIQNFLSLFQQEKANEQYNMALDKLYEAKRRSSYYGESFKLASDLALMAAKLGSPEAVILTGNIRNTLLHAKYKNINKGIYNWLKTNYDSEEDRKNFYTKLQGIEKETEYNSKSFKADELLKQLIQSSFNILQARDQIVENNLEAALETVQKLKVDNPNKGVIEALIVERSYQMSKDDDDKAKKTKNRQPHVEIEDESPSLKKKRLKKATKNNESFGESISNVSKDKEASKRNLVTVRTLSFQKTSLTTPSILVTLQGPTFEDLPSPVTETIPSKGDELEKKDNQVAIETETHPLLKLLPPKKRVHVIERPAKNSNKKWLGYFLMGAGILLIVTGIIGLGLISGGSTLFIFTGLMIFGGFTGLLGLRVAKPSCTPCSPDHRKELIVNPADYEYDKKGNESIPYYQAPVNMHLKNKEKPPSHDPVPKEYQEGFSYSR